MTEPDFESEPYKTAFAMYPEIDAMFREFPNYPIPGDWTLINRQQCKVQAKFFEAVYRLP